MKQKVAAERKGKGKCTLIGLLDLDSIFKPCLECKHNSSLWRSMIGKVFLKNDKIYQFLKENKLSELLHDRFQIPAEQQLRTARWHTGRLSLASTSASLLQKGPG